MKSALFLVAISTLLIFGGCSSESKKDPTTKEQTSASTTAPQSVSGPITLKSMDGQSIVVTPIEKGFRFSGYENKVVLVNFFATWCPPCKAEIPHLNSLQDKFKENFVIISVLLEENKSNEEIQSFMKYHNINYIITNSNENFTFAQSVGGVKNIPLMFLYDKSGRYATHYVGAVPEEMLEFDIKKAL